MKAGICIAAAAIVLCAAALYCRHRRKGAEPTAGAEKAERKFLAEWTAVLEADARVFNGLYSGLSRVQSGTAGRPEKVLREWCRRTHYRWEGQPADILCREHIDPVIEAGDGKTLARWAGLLLKAAADAGITKQTAEKLTLTEESADDYVEWDGSELYPEAEVEVIAPAWYQKGKLLEQGQCRKVIAEEK